MGYWYLRHWFFYSELPYYSVIQICVLIDT
jgi:hypothetical protein